MIEATIGRTSRRYGVHSVDVSTGKNTTPSSNPNILHISTSAHHIFCHSVRKKRQRLKNEYIYQGTHQLPSKVHRANGASTHTHTHNGRGAARGHYNAGPGSCTSGACTLSVSVCVPSSIIAGIWTAHWNASTRALRVCPLWIQAVVVSN